MDKKVSNFVMIILGLCFGLIFLVLLGFVAIQFFAMAKGQVLELAMPAPTATPVQSAEATSVALQTAGACGMSGSMNILAVGRIIDKQGYAGDAGVIRLVKADFDQPEILIFAFPPDLIVATPHLKDTYGVSSARLGSIYSVIAKAKGGNANVDFEATQAIAQAILDNFGVTVDRYVTVKRDVAIQVVDALGGVEIEVPADFVAPSGLTGQQISLKAGKYLVTSEMLHAYASKRGSVQEEWLRIAHQDVILEGLCEKVKDPAVLARVPELFTQFQSALVTNLTLAEVVSLGCLAKNAPEETMETLNPSTLTIQDDGAIWANDYLTTRTEIQNLFIDQ
jgi:LCP family protein required for cell wall assembly